MKGIGNDIATRLNRGGDRHLRLAVTGLSRSGKTAFITSLVNQLLHVNHGARLPLFNAAREGRILGVRRVSQRFLEIPRFTYDEGMAQLMSTPPEWPSPTRGIGEIRLAIRYRSQSSLLRHLKQHSTLYLEIIDYPGEWLLDLPMLEQDYFTWSAQMLTLLKGARGEWAARWQQLCAEFDPYGPADENKLASLADAWRDYLLKCKQQGLHFIQPGRFVLPGELAGAPVLQFFPLPVTNSATLPPEKAGKETNIGMLRTRYDYYCQHVVRAFYKNHFLRFDRQIVLVDCLQALNRGPDAFSDMRLAMTQLMESFSYGKRTLFRRLFSPVIDKLLFAASKSDHVTADQHGNLVSLLEQLVQDAWQHAAFEGVTRQCIGLSSVQATESGIVEQNGERIAVLRGHRLADDEELMFYPGDVPPRLPGAPFWQQQGFDFEQFRPLVMESDQPLPHIRMDSALEFLLGDKLR
ncbi:MAG: putative protein YcjX [Candidatus Erwinia impunctatus]|nr:putative protein YcjX [Culicoides impunctatus]